MDGRTPIYLLTLFGLGLLTPLTSTWAQAPPPSHLGYGINVRQADRIPELFSPLGLEWVKLWEEYEPSPPTERLPYQVLFAIWCAGRPDDPDAWGDHVAAIAQAGKGLVEAYEICNEPNTARFWGNEPPDPVQYVQTLRVAYERIKAVDPGAIIVSAGLAPVGRIGGTCNGWEGNDCGAMDEREYARQMLLLGAGDYCDAFGYHPYGFAYAPETDADTVSNGFTFRGAEVMHNLLVEQGLGDKPLWATEFNWLRDWREDGGLPSYCLDEYEAIFGWMEIPAVQQADYLTRAFHYADDHWPWMGAMFVWNLDWHDYHYNWDCGAAHARYFSLRRYTANDPAGAPTPAYDALAAMEKRPGHFGPRLTVEPDALSLQAPYGHTTTVTTALSIGNAGYRVLTWTAAPLPGTVTPTLAVTTGRQGEHLTVTLDLHGYSTGIFTGGLLITATSDRPAGVLTPVREIPLTLTVVSPHPRMLIVPPTLSFLTAADRAGPLTGTILILSDGAAFTWTARLSDTITPVGSGSLGLQITPTLLVTTGLSGRPLTVTLNTTGYTPGRYLAALRVSATTTAVLDSPQTVPLLLTVWEEIHPVYLPLILRRHPPMDTAQKGTFVIDKATARLYNCPGYGERAGNDFRRENEPFTPPGRSITLHPVRAMRADLPL